jgi:hypothetical protein
VLPEQIGHFLPAAEAKDLLTLFEAHMSPPRWANLRAAE